MVFPVCLSVPTPLRARFRGDDQWLSFRTNATEFLFPLGSRFSGDETNYYARGRLSAVGPSPSAISNQKRPAGRVHDFSQCVTGERRNASNAIPSPPISS